MRLELRKRAAMLLMCGCLFVTGCLGNHREQNENEIPTQPGITLTLEPPDENKLITATATRTLLTRRPQVVETPTNRIPKTPRPSVSPAIISPTPEATVSLTPDVTQTATPLPVTNTAEFTPTATDAVSDTAELNSIQPGQIYAEGGKFWKLDENGKAKEFVVIGVNRYNLLRDNETNNGCGSEFSDDELEPWFSGLHDMGVNVVRVWTFQDYMQEPTPEDTIDNRFDKFDKLLEIAGKNDITLLPVMRNQWSPCDDRYYDPEFFDENGNTNNAWYTKGYKVANGIEPKSYRAFVQEFTERYKGDPRIFAIGLVNEPEGDFAALFAFADDITGMINGIDPNRLTTLGTLGGGQPGTGGEFYEGLGSVKNLDILEFHDYTPEETIPGDEWNGPSVNLVTAEELNKPIIVGELGIPAGCDDCYSPEERADIFAEKIEAYSGEGVDGIIFWSGAEAQNATDEDYYAIDFDDPAAEVIYEASVTYGNLLER